MSELISHARTFEFAQPAWLLLLVLLWPLLRRQTQAAPHAAIPYSSLSLISPLGRPVNARVDRAARWLPLAAAALIVVAIARPRVEKGADERKSEGIDIMLVVDASRSMDSKDFEFAGAKVSRREALQKALGEFITRRTEDRIGIIGFAEKPFLVSPLTIDHSWMLEAMAEMKTSLGTAIGSGIEAAIDLLRRAGSENRIIIVVTDGLNTSGSDPLESARLARRLGLRVYSIGVIGYDDMKTGDLDSLLLAQIARLTGGQFFQAADGAALDAIYRQIDQFERQAFVQPRLIAFRELFPWLACAAFTLIALDVALGCGRRLRFP